MSVMIIEAMSVVIQVGNVTMLHKDISVNGHTGM